MSAHAFLSVFRAVLFCTYLYFVKLAPVFNLIRFLSANQLMDGNSFNLFNGHYFNALLTNPIVIQILIPGICIPSY